MDVVVQHAPRFAGDDAERIARSAFGVVGTATPLASERDQNFRLACLDGRRFILKIANATERRAQLEFENAVLAHLAARSPGPSVPRVQPSTGGETIVRVTAPDGAVHMVRLLSWVEGPMLSAVTPHSQTLLTSLGQSVAAVDRALADFSHPEMSRPLRWDPARTQWVVPELARFADPDRRRMVERILERHRTRVLPRWETLRHQVVHLDWNDNNVVVASEATADRTVAGVIDFGDMVHTCLVGDLAVACTYAMMGKPDPVGAAATVVGGYHRELPLTEEEIDLLYDLIGARLATSVAMSACQAEVAPHNAYLRISEEAAWTLIGQLDRIHPNLARARFRHACGLPPCPHSVAVARWLHDHRGSFAPLMGRDLPTTPHVVLDLSVGSLEIDRPERVQDPASFSAHVAERLQAAGALVGIGRYDEARLVYVTELFQHRTNWTTEHRTIHLGIDVFARAGSPVFAPIDGVVHSVADNTAAGDYGPTIVLEHDVDEGHVRFYTLYGHLSRPSLHALAPGTPVARGQRIGWIGDVAVNGGWPPHLHVQVVTDMLGRSGEFPGVAAPGEREVWLSLCPDANAIVGVPDESFPPTPPSIDTMVAARRQRLGPNLSLSYARPLAMVRGSMQYLFDADGRRYLDVVNNVPHVGHSHPRVVAAVARQMAVLNTNTRYLHRAAIEYADRLCAMLPEPLRVCYLVCSGSEANELALRLARAYTGRRDLVVVDGAYHGNTTSLIEASPYKHAGPGGSGAPAHVHTVPMPDVFGGPFRGPEAGRRYAGEVAAAIERAREAGRDVAAFIAESILSCGGQIVLPPGYLAASYAAVRGAGGVAIADEVQVGFGRVGSHLWAFETQGVVPDIVTLGKPIGNGFPLGAVVTTATIASAFDNGMEYFNTYGGGQAASAAGMAVLDVIRDEGLQQRALEVGGFLQEQLTALMSEFPIVGDVRGLGLFLGVELVCDRTTLAPAARQADYVVNRLRDRGMLVSTDGPLHNVLKMKPPLQFSTDNASRLVSALAETLAEDPAREPA